LKCFNHLMMVTVGHVDISGAVQGAHEQVVNFFKKSKLDREKLSKIWALSDVNEDGYLDFAEFSIAMHLVVLYVKGSVDIPEKLPISARPPVTAPRNSGSFSSYIFFNMAERLYIFYWCDPDQVFRRSAMKAAQRDRNHYWSDMALRIETAARLDDNRKLFLFLHKATITRETISEMIRDSNGVPVKSIKDRLIRWKEFFEIKLNHEAPVAPDIADTVAGPYVCNCESPTEEEIISVINKLKANKAPRRWSSDRTHQMLSIILHSVS
uniref:Calmodulin n=1 Tax=Dracunculus medinensis TaxID=318479 RepID=A0A0N4UFM7_DRAME